MHATDEIDSSAGVDMDDEKHDRASDFGGMPWNRIRAPRNSSSAGEVPLEDGELEHLRPIRRARGGAAVFLRLRLTVIQLPNKMGSGFFGNGL